MKIKRIVMQTRRDFQAEYECEHCGHVQVGGGYDDNNWHENVIPTMKCESCGKIADDSYRPLATKYSEHTTV